MPKHAREEIYEAHDALEYLVQNLYDISFEEAKDTDSYKKLAKFLPPKPRPTMNRIAWNDDMHYMAEAYHIVFGEVYMLEPEGERTSCCVNPLCKHEVLSVRRRDLAPTGKRYTLTEVQE